MTTQSKCVSLELARELDKRGIKVDSEFVWLSTEYGNCKSILVHKSNWKERGCKHVSGNNYFTVISTPLPCELLEVLPYVENEDGYFCNVNLCKVSDGYLAQYLDTEYFEAGKTGANALAKLLIKLSDEGLIEVGG